MDLECRASVEKKPVISLRFCCCCGGAAVRERVLSTLEYTLCLQKCAKPWRLYDVDPPQTKLVIYNYDCFCFFEGIFPLTFLFFFLPSFPFYSLIIATLWFRAPVDYLLFFCFFSISSFSALFPFTVPFWRKKWDASHRTFVGRRLTGNDK